MTLTRQSSKAASRLAAVRKMYEVHDHQHAAAILIQDFPDLFIEICNVLLTFKLSEEQIKKAGGNESEIPKAFAAMLRPLGWQEKKLTARMLVDDEEVSTDTHHIDFVKGKVAFDLEWNSKDQTFDRDLYAFRAFFDYGKIAVGVLVTRSDELESYFSELGEYVDKHGEKRKYKEKCGASTTHMGKLLPRLKAGRSGGCPVLTIGITRKQLEVSNAKGL
jgi:hypothetical protein